MRIRKRKWEDIELKNSKIYINNPENLKKILKEKYTKYNFERTEIELGIGKGEFLSQIASENLNTMYIGFEIAGTMLAESNRKILQKYKEKNIQEINNCLIIRNNIDYLIYTFLGEKYVQDNNFIRIQDIKIEENLKVDRIYINFCNPCPKQRHKKRRLTHFVKLLEYLKILKNGGEIFFKTDDYELFLSTLTYLKYIDEYILNESKIENKINLKEFEKIVDNEVEVLKKKTHYEIKKIWKNESKKYELIDYTFNLENEDIFENRLGNIQKNIETEHEKMFKKQNIKINGMIIKSLGE